MKLEKEKSLLDELAEKTGCDYLSDLPGYVGSSSFHNGHRSSAGLASFGMGRSGRIPYRQKAGISK